MVNQIQRLRHANWPAGAAPHNRGGAKAGEAALSELNALVVTSFRNFSKNQLFFRKKNSFQPQAL